MLYAFGFCSNSCHCSQDPIVDLFHVCSKSISVFNRCIPEDVVCYAEFAQELVTFISDNNVFRRVIAGVMASKEIIMGLCLLALGMTHSFIWFTVMSVFCVLMCMFVCVFVWKCIYVFPGENSSGFHAMRKNCTCKRTHVNFVLRITGHALVVSCCPLTADIYPP